MKQSRGNPASNPMRAWIQHGIQEWVPPLPSLVQCKETISDGTQTLEFIFDHHVEAYHETGSVDKSVDEPKNQTDTELFVRVDQVRNDFAVRVREKMGDFIGEGYSLGFSSAALPQSVDRKSFFSSFHFSFLYPRFQQASITGFSSVLQLSNVGNIA